MLAVRLGVVPRVSYNLREWDTAPRKIAAEGVRVRLDGFWSRPAHTLDVIAGDRRRLTLLLVQPDTDPSAAHRTMMRASERDNTDTVEELLRAGTRDSAQSTVDAWEDEGGRIPQQKMREEAL